MALLRLLPVLTLALVVAAGAFGEERPVKVEAGVGGRVVAVGDTFRLDIDVTWEDGVAVKPLALGEHVGAFAVRDISYSPTMASDGSSTRRTSLLLTVFETGEVTIPAVAVVYMDEDGNVGRVETQPISIEVESVLPADATDIRDIKRPIEVPKRWKDLILGWALLVGLCMVAAASVLVSVKRREDLEAGLRRIWLNVAGRVVGFIRWLLRRLSLIGRDEYGAPAFDAGVAEPYLTPEQAALKELARIEGMGLVEVGRFTQHHTLVSETLRRYLERRFRVLALESPTSYTLAALGEKGLSCEALSLVRTLLDETDLVKFAKLLPGKETAGTLIDRCRRMVRITGGRVREEIASEVPGA